MGNADQKIALNMAMTDSLSTYSNTEVFLCKSEDSSIIVQAQAYLQKIYLSVYQTINSTLHRKYIQINIVTYEISCAVMMYPSQMEIFMTTSDSLQQQNRIYSIKIPNPIDINEAAITFEEYPNGIKSVALIPSVNKPAILSEEYVVDYDLDAQYFFALNLDIVLQFEAFNNPRSYVLLHENSQTDPHEMSIIKITANSADTIYLPYNDELEYQKISRSVNGDLIAVLKFYKFGEEQEGALIYNQYFEPIELNLEFGDPSQYAFITFSKAPSKIILRNNANYQYSLCSYTQTNNIITVKAKDYTYNNIRINQFQQIYFNDDHHYFFLGNLFIHKNNTMEVQNDPTLYYPSNIYGENRIMINSGHIFYPIETTSSEMQIFTTQEVYLATIIQPVVNENYDEGLTLGGMIGIIVGIAAFALIALCCYLRLRFKNDGEDRQMDFQGVQFYNRHGQGQDDRQGGQRPQGSSVAPQEIPQSSENFGDENRNYEQGCSICVQRYPCNIKVFPCQDFFHKECIDRWIGLKGYKCPKCNKDIVYMQNFKKRKASAKETQGQIITDQVI